MSKIRQYFTTFVLTRGFFIALLASTFIYLNHWGLSYSILNTILGLLALYLLLSANTATWFVAGALIGLFWFWWIALSLQHYGYAWGIPVGLVLVALVYGVLFVLTAWLSDSITSLLFPYLLSKGQTHGSAPTSLLFKALGLLSLSYIHPFGFDWYKPELVFINSYIGIEKWQYAIVLFGIILSLWKKNLLYLLLVIFAYQPTHTIVTGASKHIKLVSTHTTVKDKWDETLHPSQFKQLFRTIDKAIDNNMSLIILPESVFPLFINKNPQILDTLKKKSEKISIVTGGLYWDGSTPRNSTYIFTKDNITIANKVVLVPFGESNPLPNFLSKWVNRVFYDGAIDYKADKNTTDYTIDEVTYRNAICFEATSEKLYTGHPKNMIVLSNNGWFAPSIEPTLQKLLLQYYSQKYGTIIYHSVNMSKSYKIQHSLETKE